MKRFISIAICSAALAVTPAQAQHHHGGHHGGGSLLGWIAPVVIGAAVVGTVAHMATPDPAPVVVNRPVYDPEAYPVSVGQPYIVPPSTPITQAAQSRTGSYCPTSGQFYPNVSRCNVPWQLVNY